ncbi:MAG: replicative DNA helicase [Chlamydiota bacterium]
MTRTQSKIKIAPNSKESEMMVLGCMLTKMSSLNIAADVLHPADFYYSEHQIIFQVLKELYKKDKPADIHLVAEELKRIKKLQEIGDVAYLTTLAQYAGTAAYVEEYTELIKNKSILRRMIQASQEIEKVALEDPPHVHEVLDEAQAKFFAISQQTNLQAGFKIKDLLSGMKAESGLPYLKELEARQQTYSEKGEDASIFTGIPSGFVDLDKVINGLAPSNLIICAARPAMGKTAFALNIAENACFKHQLPVGIFSLEMSAEQVLNRMICSQSGIESEKILTGSIKPGDEFQRVVEAVNQMQEQVMIIDDQPGLKVTDLRARARRMKEIHDIQLLVIDYLQLLSGSGRHYQNENRQQEISEISRMLKNLARELDIPVLCLCQLSRKVEDRQGHRPMMSDLRESGAIEQDADIVMFLLRPEYYDENAFPGTGQVIIGKNRHGATDTIKVSYQKELARFDNYIPDAPVPSDNSADAFDSFSPA